MLSQLAYVDHIQLVCHSLGIDLAHVHTMEWKYGIALRLC